MSSMGVDVFGLFDYVALAVRTSICTGRINASRQARKRLHMTFTSR